MIPSAIWLTDIMLAFRYIFVNIKNLCIHCKLTDNLDLLNIAVQKTAYRFTKFVIFESNFQPPF